MAPEGGRERNSGGNLQASTTQQTSNSVTTKTARAWRSLPFQNHYVTARIPHQSWHRLWRYHDSFPPGEAIGAAAPGERQKQRQPFKADPSPYGLSCRDTRPRVSANFPARTPDTPGGVSLHFGKIVFGKSPHPSTAVLPRCMQVCTGIFHKTPQLYLCIHPKFSCKTPIFLKKGNNCAILYARILESFPNCHHS